MMILIDPAFLQAGCLLPKLSTESKTFRKGHTAKCRAGWIWQKAPTRVTRQPQSCAFGPLVCSQYLCL